MNSIKKLFKEFGEKPIYISDWDGEVNYLAGAMKSAGLNFKTVDSEGLVFGDTFFSIIPNHEEYLGIDTALVCIDLIKNDAVVNLNDCKLTKNLINEIHSTLKKYESKISLLCLRLLVRVHIRILIFLCKIERKLFLKVRKNKTNVLIFTSKCVVLFLVIKDYHLQEIIN